jgi:hypothetical protein
MKRKEMTENNEIETRQEKREKKRRKKREQIPQHGKSLGKVYKDATLKRAKEKT